MQQITQASDNSGPGSVRRDDDDRFDVIRFASVNNSGPGSMNRDNDDDDDDRFISVNSGPGSVDDDDDGFFDDDDRLVSVNNSGPGSVNRDNDDLFDDDDDRRVGNIVSGLVIRDDDDDDRRIGNIVSGVTIRDDDDDGIFSTRRGSDDVRIRARANGGIEIRGAMITAISGASFQISVGGESFIVNAGAARLQDRDDRPIAFSNFFVGNEVRVEGVLTSTSGITATRVVNRSLEINDNVCFDDDGFFDDDDDGCVIVNPDTTAPIIALVSAAPGVTSATISWATNELSTSRVFFSTVSPLNVNAATTRSVTNAALVSGHTITLTGLTPNTTYVFAVRSIDATGNSATSGQFSFTTQPGTSGGDTTAPVVSSVTAALVTSSTATITWVTNEPATSKLFFGTITPLVLSAPTTQSVTNPALTTSHSISISGLAANTAHHFIIQSADASGNTMTTDQIQLITP